MIKASVSVVFDRVPFSASAISCMQCCSGSFGLMKRLWTFRLSSFDHILVAWNTHTHNEKLAGKFWSKFRVLSSKFMVALLVIPLSHLAKERIHFESLSFIKWRHPRPLLILRWSEARSVRFALVCCRLRILRLQGLFRRTEQGWNGRSCGKVSTAGKTVWGIQTTSACGMADSPRHCLWGDNVVMDFLSREEWSAPYVGMFLPINFDACECDVAPFRLHYNRKSFVFVSRICKFVSKLD